nr:MAG TPA: helix-turn-helix domain protein [Caudoviricetes sp.]
MLAHVGSKIALLQPSQAEHHSDVPDGYGLIVGRHRGGCHCFGHAITITTYDYKVNTPITCESVISWCICNHMRLQTQKSKTSQIVLDLLSSRGITQSALADEIGISRQVLSNKLNGIRSFTKRDYVALADFFNTSVDYLMGRTLDPWPTDNTQPEEVTA